MEDSSSSASSCVRYFLLLRARVGRNADAVGGVVADQVVCLGRLHDLPHRDQHLVLQGFRLLRDFRHNSPDMYRPHLLQLHASNVLHDVQIVGIPVHFGGGGPQPLLVGAQPDFCPLAHQGVVPHFQPRFILRLHGAHRGFQFRFGAAIHQPRFAVGKGDPLLVAAIWTAL